MSLEQNNLITFAVKLICKETSTRGEMHQPLSRLDFKESIPKQGRWQSTCGDLYDFTIELTNQYFWIYALKGRGIPRNPVLVDTLSNEKIDNPRTKDQVEPTDPVFALILFSDDPLQESLFHSPNWIEILKELLNSFCLKTLEKLIVKRCIASAEEVLTRFKNIEEIRFAENSKSLALLKEMENYPDIRRPLRDFFGFDMPTEFSISIKANFKLTKIVPFLCRLHEGNSNRVYSSLRIKGRDEGNIETILNCDTLSKKIEISAETDENGIYGSEEIERIKQALLEKVYEPQN